MSLFNKNRPSKPAGTPGFSHAGDQPKASRAKGRAGGPGFTDAGSKSQKAKRTKGAAPKATFSHPDRKGRKG